MAIFLSSCFTPKFKLKMGPVPVFVCTQTHLNLIEYLCRHDGGGMEIFMKAEDYQELSSKTAAKSPLAKDMLCAFLIGGTICALGQILYSVYYDVAKMSVQDSKTWVSITLIFLSAFLTGIGIYDKIAKFGGAGTLVPITGFANAMVSPAIEFKTEGWVLGLGTKIFAIAGPVIVYGTVASVLYGIVYYIITLG